MDGSGIKHRGMGDISLMPATIDITPYRELLARAEIDAERATKSTLGGGSNNQVIRVSDGDNTAVLKLYFRHPVDPRDRRAAEYAFATYAWHTGIRSIARPIATDAELNASMFAFVSGDKPKAGKVDLAAIDSALAFIGALNAHKDDAANLPVASDACFSIDDHILHTDRRLKRLQQLTPADDLNAEMIDFIGHDILPAWQNLVADMKTFCNHHGFSSDAHIADGDRCISPSDFGFHNAIVDADGQYYFIDFEYAGWDDPAKLVCDFFCQKAVPVPLCHFRMFISQLSGMLSLSDEHQGVIALLLPVYQIKWCCILLNDFLPTGQARRTFATGEPDQRKRQLVKARAARAALTDYTACRDDLLGAANMD